MPPKKPLISRRQFGAAVLGGGAALIAMPLAARAQQLRPRAQVDPRDRMILRIGEAALKAKLIGSGSFDALGQLGYLSAAGIRSANLPELDGPDATTFWSMFFRSAQIQIGRAESSTPVVGYYNPFLDVWWLTQWSLADGARTIVDTRFIPNERFSLSPAKGELGGLPSWLTGLERRSLIENLRLTCRGAASNFQRIFPFQGSSGQRLFANLAEPADARTAMLARMLVVSRGITTFLRDPAMSALSGQLRTALQADVPSGSGLPLSADAKETFGIIAKTPALVRRRFGVVGAVQMQDHWLAVYSSAQSGQTMLVAAIRRQGPVITRLGLVNVAAGS